MRYILSVGTNLGDRKGNIERAVDALNNIPYTDVVSVSSIYETEPVGYARQDDFYNAVLVVTSQFEPHEMLGICLGIESGVGRVRGIKNGPRILDLDIIFAENQKIETANLQVPHPRCFERRFVLQPLLEIFPDGNAFGFEFKLHKCSHTVDNIRHFVDGFFNCLFSRATFCSANHCNCRADSKRCADAFHNISLSIHFHNDSSRTFQCNYIF